MSNLGAPAIAVSMMSATSTMIPKNRENQRASRKISDPGVFSLLFPVATLRVTVRAVWVAMLISRPA